MLALRTLTPGQLKAETPLTPSSTTAQALETSSKNKINSLKKKAEKDFRWALSDDFINTGEFNSLNKTIRLIIKELKKGIGNEKKIAKLEAIQKDLEKFYNRSQAELQAKKKLNPKGEWWKLGRGIYRGSDKHVHYVVVGPFNISDNETAATDQGNSLARRYLGVEGSSQFKKLKKQVNEKGNKYWILGRVVLF